MIKTKQKRANSFLINLEPRRDTPINPIKRIRSFVIVHEFTIENPRNLKNEWKAPGTKKPSVSPKVPFAG